MNYLSDNRLLQKIYQSLFFLVLMFFAGDSEAQVTSTLIEKKALTLWIDSQGIRIKTYNNSTFALEFTRNGTFPEPTGLLHPDLETNDLQIIEEPGVFRVLNHKSELLIRKDPFSIELGAKIALESLPQFSEDRIGITFKIDSNHVFKGSGARPYPINLAGSAVENYAEKPLPYFGESTGSYQSSPAPIYLAVGQYALLFDSELPGRTRTYIGGLKKDLLEFEGRSTGHWTCYLFDGASNNEILEEYNLLTGPADLPPLFAFGYTLSPGLPMTSGEARGLLNASIAAGFKPETYIISNEWQGNPNEEGDFQWQMDDLAEFLAFLDNRQVRLALGVSPFAGLASEVYQNAGLFIQDPKVSGSPIKMPVTQAAVWDIFRPESRVFLKNSFLHLFKQGVIGLNSLDNEPEDLRNGLHFDGTPHEQIHNHYAASWNDLVTESWQEFSNNQRIFHTTQSNRPANRRLGAMPTSGPVMRYWAGLKTQIPMLLHAGMSGYPFAHTTIGGEVWDPSQPLVNEELDVRWAQLAVYTPVMKMGGDRSNLNPGLLNEPFRTYFEDAFRERYRLLPLIYHLAFEAAKKGLPMCRPMDFYQQDSLLSTLDDQYFFGENLLVAPVLLHGMPQRKIQLPEGNWFEIHSLEKQEGGKAIFQKLNQAYIPVYARSGALIPLSLNTATETRNYLSDSLELRFFHDNEPCQRTQELYVDDGITTGSYESGQYEMLAFKQETDTENIVLQLERTHNFSQGRAQRYMEITMEQILGIPNQVQVNNKEIAIVFQESEWTQNKAWYDTYSKRLKLQLLWDMTPLEIEVKKSAKILLATSSSPSFGVSIYPNPSIADRPLKMEVVFPPGINQAEFSLVNERGNVLINKCLVSASELPQVSISLKPGVYFIHIRFSPEQEISRKVIVE